MKNKFFLSILLTLQFNYTFANVDATFTANSVGGQCFTNIHIEAFGNAGPYNVKIYRIGVNGNEYLVKNTVLDNEEYNYDPILEATYKVVFTDALDCKVEKIGKILCQCNIQFNEARDIVRPTTCTTNDGSINHLHGSILSNGNGPFTLSGVMAL